jgi:hypothetical protein
VGKLSMNPPGGWRNRAVDRARPLMQPGEAPVAVIGQATASAMHGLRNMYSGAQALVLTDRRLYIVANPIEALDRGTFRLAAGRFRNTAHLSIDTTDGRHFDVWIQRSEFDQLRLMEASLGAPLTF